MKNLFGNDFMDFMVFKDIKEKRECEEATTENMWFEESNPTFGISNKATGSCRNYHHFIDKDE